MPEEWQGIPPATAREGLLEPEPLERLLRERLRALRLARLAKARARLGDAPPAALTTEEIQAEIDAYRAEQSRAAGPRH